MFIKSGIIWVFVFAFMLTSTPDDDTAVCDNIESFKFEIDFDGMDFRVPFLKSVLSDFPEYVKSSIRSGQSYLIKVVADFLEADESDIDMDLAKEVVMEVAKWYADTLKEIYTSCLVVHDCTQNSRRSRILFAFLRVKRSDTADNYGDYIGWVKI